MFCITLKHHFWEPEVEVIFSVTVSFIIYIVYFAKTTASTHAHTITKIQQTHKIEEHSKAAKTTFLNYKNTYEMKIEYKR